MSMTMLNVPVGTVIDFAGPTAPDGYLECDGSAISRTTYPILFSIIGTSWGTGDGSTTFNLPDLRGRTTIGDGTGTAGGATAHAFASTGGDERMPSHAHGHTNPTVTLPNHVHSMAHTHTINHGHGNNISYSVTSSGSCTITSSGAHTHAAKWSKDAQSGSNKSRFNTEGTNSSNNFISNTGAHTHTVPNHTHTLSKSGGVSDYSGSSGASSAANTGNPTSLPNCTVSGGGVSSNGDGTAGNMQPFATLKKLIRAA